MADPIERKRLKKKMLDRWENEGGRIGNDSTSSDDARSTSEHDGKGEQVSASRGKPKIDGAVTAVKKRKATRK